MATHTMNISRFCTILGFKEPMQLTEKVVKARTPEVCSYLNKTGCYTDPVTNVHITDWATKSSRKFEETYE